jgi:hypothetical protein
MSKIPQGAWSAIAARYENGESISAIARSYGCTPPAIHYILKRNRQRPPQAVRQLLQGQRATAAAPIGSTTSDPLPPPVLPAAKPERDTSAGLTQGTEPTVTTPSQQPAGAPNQRPMAPALTPGLDNELHRRAEAAIEMFRSSFDAALAEASPGVRERLRQAAADLMRVAARTTIVLDRSNAGSERSSRVQNYPRSAHARDDFGKSGSV